MVTEAMHTAAVICVVVKQEIGQIKNVRALNTRRFRLRYLDHDTDC